MHLAICSPAQETRDLLARLFERHRAQSGAGGAGFIFIKTVWGKGYRYCPMPTERGGVA